MSNNRKEDNLAGDEVRFYPEDEEAEIETNTVSLSALGMRFRFTLKTPQEAEALYVALLRVTEMEAD